MISFSSEKYLSLKQLKTKVLIITLLDIKLYIPINYYDKYFIDYIAYDIITKNYLRLY